MFKDLLHTLIHVIFLMKLVPLCFLFTSNVFFCGSIFWDNIFDLFQKLFHQNSKNTHKNNVSIIYLPVIKFKIPVWIANTLSQNGIYIYIYPWVKNVLFMHAVSALISSTPWTRYEVACKELSWRGKTGINRRVPCRGYWLISSYARFIMCGIC